MLNALMPILKHVRWNTLLLEQATNMLIARDSHPRVAKGIQVFYSRMSKLTLKIHCVKTAFTKQ